MRCPCDSGAALDACCGPYLRRLAVPPTAEALMRSRYTAYVRQDVDYLVETCAPRFGTVDREAIRSWAAQARWRGLQILTKVRGEAGDDYGEVEFRARYTVHDHPGAIHERSRFECRGGQWFYIDGDVHET